MAAKRINYADMTPDQKQRAEKWAKRWGTTPDKCPMTKLGIITSPKSVPHVSALDYDIMTKGDVEYLSEITDEVRKEWLEELERDLPSKEEMEHVKKTFASLR